MSGNVYRFLVVASALVGGLGVFMLVSGIVLDDGKTPPAAVLHPDVLAPLGSCLILAGVVGFFVFGWIGRPVWCREATLRFVRWVDQMRAVPPRARRPRKGKLPRGASYACPACGSNAQGFAATPVKVTGVPILLCAGCGAIWKPREEAARVSFRAGWMFGLAGAALDFMTWMAAHGRKADEACVLVEGEKAGITAQMES